MNYIKGTMYFEKTNNKIECTIYSGEELKKIKKVEVKSFKTNQKIISIALNSKSIYIQLDNGIILVFKDKNILKEEIFKSLNMELKRATFKYRIKKFVNITKYNLCKSVDTIKIQSRKFTDKTKYVLCKNISTIGTAAIVLTADIATISIAKSKEDNLAVNNVVVEDNSKIESTSIEEILNRNMGNAILFAKFESNLNTDKIIDKTPSLTESDAHDTSNNRKEISENNSSFESIDSSETNNYEISNDYGSSESDTSLVFYDDITTVDQIANTLDYYSGDIYDNFVSMMDNPQVTSELNRRISDYVFQNLEGKKMWGNAHGQGYDNYTIPDKFKNGEFTLNELFDSASEEFGVPKDILVSISQHECSQAYLIKNSYTGVYEQNCGGMMGHVDLYGMIPDYLPNGGYDGCDVTTNPAISIYSYASTIKFFHDNFKDLDVGYGLDSWDISSYMVALGLGNVTDSSIGFKYRYDHDIKGISQLNECMPQFKVLREAYLNNNLGVNDLTLTVENGVVTHWTDGEKFYYKNGEFTFNKSQNSYSYSKKY